MGFGITYSLNPKPGFRVWDLGFRFFRFGVYGNRDLRLGLGLALMDLELCRVLLGGIVWAQT